MSSLDDCIAQEQTQTFMRLRNYIGLIAVTIFVALLLEAGMSLIGESTYTRLKRQEQVDMLLKEAK